MIRATTPTHTFVFDEGVDVANTYKRINITYLQKGKIIISKNKEDLTIVDNTVSLTLTQQETIKFEKDVGSCCCGASGSSVDVQVRCLSYSGEAFASEIMHLEVDDVLNDEVLS